MGIDSQIRTSKLNDLIGTIAASANVEIIIDMTTKGSRGSLSLQLETTGTGTYKLELFLSNDDGPSVWIEDSAGDVVATQATGNIIHSITPSEFARWMKIKITEDGGANAVVVADAWLAWT
jgi:hypothetical protein